MIRTLMAAAAVSGLLLSTALAQSPSNPNQGSASQRSGDAQVISQQSPSQWLGSKLMGTDVIGLNDEKIGDVSDVLIDKSGRVDALVVGVGSFLGIGAKDIALPMTVFEVVPANSGKNNTSADQLRLSMTKDQLQQHAEFRTLADRQNTTGSGPSGSNANAPAGSARPNAGSNSGSDAPSGSNR